MSIFLNGIQNFLQIIDENWTTIIVIVALLVSIAKKASSLLKKSDNGKITVAKEQIQEIMLRLVSDAEYEYAEWTKSGSIKRAQVIEEIFDKYPILSRVTNQAELIEWIDSVIDESLDTLREVIANQDVNNTVDEADAE